tara:strand:+ start:169 stop:552 length:384 start_codon:yes stop_codon:yes gene_type:complete
MSKSYILQIDEAAGAGTKNYYLPFDRNVIIENVSIVADANVTGHDSNNVILTWYGSDGATALCSRSTKTDASGTTITAGTSEDLTLANMNKGYFSGSESMKIASVQAGSGVATKLTINVKARDARAF